MSIRKILIIPASSLCLLFAIRPVTAQSDADALRFSMLEFGTTGRAVGLGGAFGALGSDFGVASINPAGIGVYKSTELAFSPGFSFTQNSSDFLGENTTGQRFSANIGHFGLVAASDGKRDARRRTDLRGVFGIGYNRLASYQSRVEYNGFNPDNSLTDAWLQVLNDGGGTAENDIESRDPFGGFLGYEAFLINPSTSDSMQYFSVLPDGDINQNLSSVNRGAHNEFDISYAVDWKGIVYVGATVGIPLVRYRTIRNWTEDDAIGALDGFQEFTFREEINTRGSGLNAKLGVIVRPTKSLRLGAAVHSPTRLRLSDDYTTEISSVLNNVGEFEAFSDFGIFNYNLTTPWRAVGSIGVVIQKFGILSVDYEWVDYTTMSFDFGSDFVAEANSVNRRIDDKYRAVGNIRAGLEVKLDDWRIRGGYAMMASPFEDGVAAEGADFGRQTISGGFGYRGESFFADFAYAHVMTTEYDAQYTLSDPAEPIHGAIIDRVTGNAVVTIGLRF